MLWMRLVFLCLLLPSALLADIVQLKDGRTLRGRIVAQDRETVTLRAHDGDYLIYRDQMVRYFYDDPDVLDSQLELERQREANHQEAGIETRPAPVEPGQRADESAVRPADVSRPRPQKEEEPARRRLIFQISGGAGSMRALYPEFFKEDRTADYIQQSISLTSSVSYPYEMSYSRATSYAANIYFETDRMAGGIETFYAKNSGGYQMLETLTNSGRFYAGAGSFSENTVLLYRLRPAVLIGSRSWPVQPFLFGGPNILEMKTRANQTEVLTSASTLASSAVYSPTITSTARAQGMGGGLELRWFLGSLFEVRARGGYASLKGGFKTSELRIPLQDAAVYQAGGAYASLVEGSAKLRTTLTDVRGAVFFRASNWMRVFVEYQSLTLRNNIEGYGLLRLPDNALVPGATIHGDLYRTLGVSRSASIGTYRAGLEFSAF